MKKVVWITGAKGQLGTELFLKHHSLAPLTFHFSDIDELDLTDRQKVLDYVRKIKPWIIINCAAYTAVDKAETETEKAFLVNRDVPSFLTEAASENDSVIIHISTDFVFNGPHDIPYTENDIPDPASVYAKSKLAGEKEILKKEGNIVIRTAWLYSQHGNNFVKSIIRLAQERTEINVVDDQIGSPTSAGDLADAILEIVLTLYRSAGSFGGIYHYTNEGVTSRYEFACEIIKMAGLNCMVNPVKTRQYPLPAVRPSYSALNLDKTKNTFGITIKNWKESLRDVISSLQQRQQ